MAIPTPRAIFACAIPAIVVILSYIWFKRKKEIRGSCVDGSSSRSSSSRHSGQYRAEEIKAFVRSPKADFEKEAFACGEPAPASRMVADKNDPSSDKEASDKECDVYEALHEYASSSNADGDIPVNVCGQFREITREPAAPTERVEAEPDAPVSDPIEAEVHVCAEETDVDTLCESVARLDALALEGAAANVDSDGRLSDSLSTTVTDVAETPTRDSSDDTLTSVPSVSFAEPDAGDVDCKELEEEAFLAPSPGLSADEPELQKLVNCNSTSAYGSSSHSPADELPESPTASNYSDLHSEGSSDSGKGGSDIHTPSVEGSSGNFPYTPLQVYEFEIPQGLCGRLIGQRGRYVNLIKSKSRANISIKRHPYNPELKLCAVIGTEEDINAALVLIRRRFPTAKYPVVNMLQVNAPLLNGIPIPDTLQLHLPDSVTCDVILSSLVTAGHFFVQQPTHPTYSSLSRLDQCMLACYLNGVGAPELPAPVEPGIICSASTMGGWYRAQIVYVYPDSDECEVKFVDYGGYSRESISSLRQIRSDFMTLPFQASECFLANVSPIDESQGWTVEASSCFEELAQGQILQAQIVTYSEEGIPYVHLYRVQGVMTTFINRELVSCGVARWIEHPA